MKQSMYIHNLFKHLRTTEGIIRERLQLSDQDWRIATQKYGFLRFQECVSDGLESDLDNLPVDASYLGNSTRHRIM